MEDTLYREEVLDHYRNPQHFGKPKTYTISSKQINPFCGDEIEMYLHINPTSLKLRGASNGKELIVKDVGFVGVGCAICIAGASLLTEFTLGKSKDELTKFSEKDMLSLLGVEVSESRKKCAFLARATLQDCLK